MHILEGCHRIIRISEVPDIEVWVLVIIIGHQELSGDLRVPDQAGFSHSGLLVLSFLLLVLVLAHPTAIKVIKIVILSTSSS